MEKLFVNILFLKYEYKGELSWNFASLTQLNLNKQIWKYVLVKKILMIYINYRTENYMNNHKNMLIYF